MACGQFGVMWKKLKPYLLVVSLQFGSAGIYIISMITLNHGMNRFVLIVYRNAAAALFLAPFALVLERTTRPKMTISTFLHIMVLAFLEPIVDQGFTYLGMKYTSASFTSAIMNAVPSVTFVIAVIFRVESVKMKEVRSQAKVIGTLVTFAGALLMTMYKGPVVDLLWSHKTSSHSSTTTSSDQHWVTGTLFILIGCVAWSCFYVLQSITVKKYPANISLSCLICLVGALQGAAVAVTVERRASAWAVGWDSRLLAPLYSGIIGSGITYYVQGLVMKTRGPVFVTAFNPLCMIIVSILGSIILAEKLHLGRKNNGMYKVCCDVVRLVTQLFLGTNTLEKTWVMQVGQGSEPVMLHPNSNIPAIIIGGVIIVFGLYSVVWGKSKDYCKSSAVPCPAMKDEAHELPISSGSAISGTKLVIDKNGSDQPSQMQYMTVQK